MSDSAMPETQPFSPEPTPPSKVTVDARPRRFWHVHPWKWCFSLRTGVVLLALLTVVSVVGTLIPETEQQSSLDRARQMVYHTPWFALILFSLAINISCATVRMVIERILPSHRVRFRRSATYFDSAKSAQSLPFDGDAAGAAGAFAQKGFKTATEDAYGYAWKGKAGRWGSPVSHLGAVIVLVGGFASAWVAQEGRLILGEGDEASTFVLSEDIEDYRNRFNAAKEQGKDTREVLPKETSLGFTVKCDDFETAFHPRTQMPSKYVSTVTILDSTPPVIAEGVEVNHSLHVGGWVFHQTSFKEQAGAKRFLLSVEPPDSPAPLLVEVSPGQRRILSEFGRTGIFLEPEYPYSWSIALNEGEVYQGMLFEPSQGLRLRVERFEPDFFLGPDRKPSSRSQELKNPAVYASLYDGDEKVFGQWLFGREELKSIMHRQEGAYKLDLAGVAGEAPDYRFQIKAERLGEMGDMGAFVLTLGEETVIGAVSPAEDAVANPAISPEDDPAAWRVRLVRAVPAYSTTLTLTRNAALPAVYFGCLLMTLGLALAFGINRREVWFRIDPEQKRIQVVGRYRYERQTLDKHTSLALQALCGDAALSAGNQEPDSPKGTIT